MPFNYLLNLPIFVLCAFILRHNWSDFMDFVSIIGLIVGFSSMVVAFLIEGGSIASLLQITAATIVFGGTIAATMTSFPLKELKKIPGMFKSIFFEKEFNEVEIINQLASYSEKARKEGLLSLESVIEENPNPMIRKGLMFVVDGIEPQVVRDILDRESFLHEQEYRAGAEIFEAAGGYSPTMGIVGTVMGLISVLSSLDDPSHLGEAIAVAFVATLYGVAFANLMWLPFANKIKVKAKKEVMVNDLIIEGLLAIQAGENPKIIKEKLNLSLIEKLSGTKKESGEETETKEEEKVRSEEV